MRINTTNELQRSQTVGVCAGSVYDWMDRAGSTMLLDALEDKLARLEEQIDRIVADASGQGARARSRDEQQQSWDLARDLQREARTVRDEIRRARHAKQ
jgi:F0F1-type ATP synthase membrane subunit b/b'